MKKGRVWLSAVLTALMIASFVLAPGVTTAEKPDKTAVEREMLKKEKVNRVREAIERGAYRGPSPSRSSDVKARSVGEVRYSGAVDWTTDHIYYFETSASGTVTIRDNVATEKIYEIWNLDTDEVYYGQTSYTLPAGRYIIHIYTWVDALVTYDYTLSGSTVVYAPTELPQLNVTQPANHHVRLPKSYPYLTVSGNTDGVELWLSVDGEEYSLQTPNFNETIQISDGHYWMRMESFHANGNSILRWYDIISPGIKRISGKNRYDVSANVSKQIRSSYPPPGTIFLARSDLFTDALSGVPLASVEYGPLLLTKTETLPSAIKTEIQQLQPSRAVILGGTSSVSTNVESQLKQMGIKVERIGGKNRYDVSAKVAERVIEGSGQNTVIVVNGTIFSDALSASGAAGGYGMPILLVSQDAVPASIQSFLKNHPEIDYAIIVGGPKTVSTGVESQLKKMGLAVDRIGGANRYDVSVNVAEYFGPFRSLVFARGDVFADGLSGGPLAAHSGSTIMLTPSDRLSVYTKAYLDRNSGNFDYMYLLGGEISITPNLAKQLDSYIK